MLFQMLILTFLVPYTQDKARSTIRESSINFFDNFIKPKKFNDVIKGVTIYTEEKEPDGLLKNIYIKKITRPDEFEITYAKSGVIKSINNKHILVLYDGQNIKGKNKKLDSFSFSKSDFNLTNLESNTTTYKKIQENSSIDLFKCYFSLDGKNIVKDKKKFKIENCSKENLSNILGELYKRLIIPLYIPIFILISMLLVITSKENLNYTKVKISIFVIGFSIIIFSETTLRFVENTIYQNFKIIVIPFLIILFLYQFVFRKLSNNQNLN